MTAEQNFMTAELNFRLCARRLDLDVFTWSPTDGPTRYRFAKAGRYRSYSECDTARCPTASGLAEAGAILSTFGWMPRLRNGTRVNTLMTGR